MFLFSFVIVSDTDVVFHFNDKIIEKDYGCLFVRSIVTQMHSKVAIRKVYLAFDSVFCER